MIKLSDLKLGDYVLVEADGKEWQGEVVDFNHNEKEVGVDTGVQKFFFRMEDIRPIPLSDAVLTKMNFEREVHQDGSVKYKKGAFRVLIPQKDDFSHFEIWYRDEKRHILSPIYLHELQNHYEAMTKVHLTEGAI